MMLCGFVAVKDSAPRVALRDRRFASRQRVVRGDAEFGGVIAMPRRLLVVVGGRGVVLCTAEAGLCDSGIFGRAIRGVRRCGRISRGLIPFCHLAMVDRL